MRTSSLAAALVAAVLLDGGARSASAQAIITGTTGEGAIYEFVVPDVWNGDLVVYAHGIVDPGRPLALPSATNQDEFRAIRDMLVGRGYAVASTSYSENGYAIKDGARRVHQLSGLFASRVARPDRVYLAGHSLGAAVVQSLAERFPGQYDGALAMCGLLGGTIPELQYVGDARVLFDFFFPGTLPYETFPTELVDFQAGSPAFLAVLNALLAGLAPPDFRTVRFAVAAGLPPFALPNEAPLLIDAAVRVVGFNLRFSADLLDRTHGRPAYDNTATDYGDPVINAGVTRIRATADAVNYAERYYTPTGELKIPMVTLHTTRDPLVPIFHEPLYAAIVGEAGYAHNLRQRTADAYGHCAFTEAQVLAAFDELTTWVDPNP